MKTGLLLLSVCILTTVCAFAQNEQKRPFERENHRERAPQSTFFSLRESENPEIRRGRTPIATLQSATATHRLDSVIYVEIWNDEEWKAKATFEYDSNGNVIIEASYRWENNAWIERWKSENTFDDNGNMIMRISYDYYCWAIPGGVYCSRFRRKNRFEYDDSGNMIMEITYYWGNNMWIESQKTEFVFDNNGNLIMRIYYNWGDNMWIESQKTEFTFDDNGNMIMQIFYWWENNAWVGIRKYESTFDDNGNMIMQIFYRWENNAWVESWKVEYTFDDNGNRIMTIRYHWENNAWIEEWKVESTFDNNGNLTMWIDYLWGNNAWVESWKVEYTFDDNGNRIMTIRYHWENNAWIEEWKMTIEYDLSVLFSNVLFPFDEDEFELLLGEYELSFYNKPIRWRGYRRIENTWQEIGVMTFYYSKLSTNNIPSVSATSISIFPNPASYHFTISGITENTLVTVTNLTGQIVLQQVVSPSESVSVNHLPAGIYIVSVNGESQRLIVR